MLQANAIRNGFLIIIVFFVAIWLGVSVVTEQTETILKIGATILILTGAYLGRKIWLLMVFFTALNVPLIRGFGTVELGEFMFIGFSIIMLLMRRLPLKVTLAEKEVWILLVAACVVQVYFRNPVGLGIFGAGNVGAKPYFLITLSFFTAIILGNIQVNPTEIRWLFKLSIFGEILGMGLTSLRMRAGGGGQIEGFERSSQMADSGGSGRLGSIGTLGIESAKVTVAFISPIRALRRPLWLLLILFSLVAAAGSGYRNVVAYTGLIYIIGLAYRGGFGSVLLATVSTSCILGLLALVNLISPLPGNIQRALSPFPGTWEKRHVEAAEASTEWRVQMWKEALFTDYWIQNKILGDGLGLTARELKLMESADDGSAIKMNSLGSGLSAQQENLMLAGGYHSGPVHTVRIVGYVGLIILVLAMIRIAVHAHRQINRTRGTEWYPVALYIGVPIIAQPIFFVFVFGDFGGAASYLMMSYAMISVFEKNLPLPPYIKPIYVPYILQRGNVAKSRRKGEATLS